MGGFGGVSAIVGILVVIPNAMCRIDQEGRYLHKYLMLLVKMTPFIGSFRKPNPYI